MYLETIYLLSQQKSAVRSIDIAEYMGYSKPSVSRAVNLLKTGGYLLADADGHLSLTDSGKEAAKSIFERHTLLSNFLIQLGVDEETAANDACKIEHVVSEQTIAAIKTFLQKQ